MINEEICGFDRCIPRRLVETIEKTKEERYEEVKWYSNRLNNTWMNRVVADFSPKRGGRNDGGEVSQQFVARWKARGVYGSSKTIEKVYSAGWKYPARITSCIRVRGRFAWMYVTRTMLIDNCFHFHTRNLRSGITVHQ